MFLLILLLSSKHLFTNNKRLCKVIGAIIGDIIGSVYEFKPTKDYNFELFKEGSKFTDDTVLTIAIADSLLNNVSFKDSVYKWARKHPKRGYGRKFWKWMTSKEPQSYNSLGNGSAMRVSPIGFLNINLNKKLKLAEESAIITHNHPEGIKGALATAFAIHSALVGKDKWYIKKEIEERYNYDLSRNYNSIKEDYKYDITCPGSVPEAIIAFLESKDYESTIRFAVALGGDADTQACIAGGIAQAYYKEIPPDFIDSAFELLPEEIKQIIINFNSKILGQL